MKRWPCRRFALRAHCESATFCGPHHQAKALMSPRGPSRRYRRIRHCAALWVKRTCPVREPNNAWRASGAAPTPSACRRSTPRNYADARQHRIAAAFEDQQQRPDCYLSFRAIQRHLRKRLDELPRIATAGQRSAMAQLDGIKEQLFPAHSGRASHAARNAFLASSRLNVLPLGPPGKCPNQAHCSVRAPSTRYILPTVSPSNVTTLKSSGRLSPAMMHGWRRRGDRSWAAPVPWRSHRPPV
jgi:hypothetical protein